MRTYGPTDALTLLLTVEGLLFAALSIGVATAQRQLGQTRSPFPLVVSLVVVLVIALVAAGATSAWSHIYETHPGAADATDLEIEGIALIAAIVAQPFIALAYVLWIFLRSG